MVSGLICNCHSFLNLRRDRKSYVMIASRLVKLPRLLYKLNEDLEKQLQLIIPLFEETHSVCDVYSNFVIINARRSDDLSNSALTLAVERRGRSDVTRPYTAKEISDRNQMGLCLFHHSENYGKF